jgi:hypothetical protein
MTLLPEARQSPPPAKSTARPASIAKAAWLQAVAAIMTPDLSAVIAFCLIGFLLTLNLMLRFPNLGAVIAQYNQF